MRNACTAIAAHRPAIAIPARVTRSGTESAFRRRIHLSSRIYCCGWSPPCSAPVDRFGPACGLPWSGLGSLSRAGPAPSAGEKPPRSCRQETGFLNRSIELHGVAYRFQVYLPEEWRRDDGKLWPIILFLHGRGERGSEGMWQTQIGLPEAVRDHPERWPFVIVMPQCPQAPLLDRPRLLELAMATLDQETAEFHGDPERTYLSGLSLGGYGAWELARLHPHRWAAVAIAAGGVFWSYAPERWQQVSTLPAEYAHALGRTPVWLFHGTDDPVVVAPPERTDVRGLQGRRRPHPSVALPGPEARLLDPRLSTSRSCRAGCSIIVLSPRRPQTRTPRATSRSRPPWPSAWSFPFTRPPSGLHRRSWKTWWANISNQTATLPSRSSGRASGSTPGTATAKSPSWPPSRPPSFSIPTAPAPPGSSPSAMPRAASSPSSSATTAMKSDGRNAGRQANAVRSR